MPQHCRPRKRDLGLEHVQVRVADAARDQPDERFTRTRPGHRYGQDLQVWLVVGQDGGPHLLRDNVRNRR